MDESLSPPVPYSDSSRETPGKTQAEEAQAGAGRPQPPATVASLSEFIPVYYRRLNLQNERSLTRQKCQKCAKTNSKSLN